MFVGYSLYVQANETKTWRKVNATVISTTVVRVVVKRGVAYCPKVLVSVEKAGTPYNADLEISQYPCDPIKQSVESAANAFSVGKPLEVFVNPSNPGNVRLGTYSIGEVFYLIVFAGLLMFGATITISRQLIQAMCVKHDG
jgi:hypothetical protein